MPWAAKGEGEGEGKRARRGDFAHQGAERGEVWGFQEDEGVDCGAALGAGRGEDHRELLLGEGLGGGHFPCWPLSGWFYVWRGDWERREDWKSTVVGRICWAGLDRMLGWTMELAEDFTQRWESDSGEEILA